MNLSVSHKTSYSYENKVELNAHTIYLKPLQRPYYKVDNYNIKIFPDPEGLVERLSIEGNPYFQAWFRGLTDHLEINTSFKVDTTPFNPFSFIIDLDFLNNVNVEREKFFKYNDKEEPLLFPYLLEIKNATLHEFANIEFYKSPDHPISYLMALTSRVHKEWSHIIREEENLWSPEKTFAEKEGSCRDLSWMLIHMLRMQGIASRFVSGYAYNSEIEEGHELHAWVEAFLPGAGWVGMDPSLGLFTDDRYIPLACSSDAQFTLPIHGNYAGVGTARLSTTVHIAPV